MTKRLENLAPLNVQNDELKLPFEELETIRRSALNLEAALPRATALHPNYLSASAMLRSLELARDNHPSPQSANMGVTLVEIATRACVIHVRAGRPEVPHRLEAEA